LRPGRIVAQGIRVWLHRSLPILAFAALCLLPVALSAESTDPSSFGLFGLYPSAWAVSLDLLEPRAGRLSDVALAYFAQFAVTVVVVRHAHRRLAGRAPRAGPLALLGLAPLALGSLAAFALLDSVVAAAFERSDSALPVLLFIPNAVAQAFLAATFSLALPAIAVDGHGIFSALGRARLLVHGSGFAIFSVLALTFVLQWVMVIPFGMVAGLLGLEQGGQLMFAVPAILFVTLKACILAAAYHEACVRKEGARADELGAIFA
jgi:hypothetical protein